MKIKVSLTLVDIELTKEIAARYMAKQTQGNIQGNRKHNKMPNKTKARSRSNSKSKSSKNKSNQNKGKAKTIEGYLKNQSSPSSSSFSSSLSLLCSFLLSSSSLLLSPTHRPRRQTPHRGSTPGPGSSWPTWPAPLAASASGRPVPRRARAQTRGSSLPGL